MHYRQGGQGVILRTGLSCPFYLRTMERSKYNVDSKTVRRTFDGVVYDSEMEMKFYRDWVKPRMESGEITSCDRQITYELQQSFMRNGKRV